jgi:hypothetical protein
VTCILHISFLYSYVSYSYVLALHGVRLSVDFVCRYGSWVVDGNGYLSFVVLHIFWGFLERMHHGVCGLYSLPRVRTNGLSVIH